MAIDKRVASAAAAIGDVPDGATVLISGFGGAGFANTLIDALREVGPRDLTLVVSSATHRTSTTHTLIEAGLVRRVMCSAARGTGREPSVFDRLHAEGRIELAVMPQGAFAERIRAGGAGIPAGDGDHRQPGAAARQQRGPLRQHRVPLRAGKFRPVMAAAVAVEVRRHEAEPMPHDRAQLPGAYVSRVFAIGE